MKQYGNMIFFQLPRSPYLSRLMFRLAAPLLYSTQQDFARVLVASIIYTFSGND
jgi:hypothetical protein